MASSRCLSQFTILLAVVVSLAEAKDFMVGGKDDAWKVPSTSEDSLNKWAEANRFRIEDSLVWKNAAGKDSVLQVTRGAYQDCNISNPIAAFTGGEAKVKLNRSGPFFFISGDKQNCENGEKLIVVVLSAKRREISIDSPAPAPIDSDAPALAPTSAASGLQPFKYGFLGLSVGVVGLLL